MARYNSTTKLPELYYEEVDVSLITPRKRDYTKAKKGAK
jgi:succinate dehydrogenase / fumarate reductase flavoprotein subunit